MKKSIVVGSISFILLIVIVVVYLLLHPISVSFAEKITLSYQYADKSVNVQITDQDDINTLVSICKGNDRTDNPSCGFGAVITYFIHV